MSQELIFTSAPRGLRPGSSGIGSVVVTAGMNPKMMKCLESLSEYRRTYDLHDPNAHLNPVVFSHLLVMVAGRPYHVLSRVADAGLDYSGRNNRLAHHVVLDVVERVPGGPAWLLRRPGFLETTFDGQPRVLPAGRNPPKGDETPGVCRHWGRLTGDAGWGGAVAEAAAQGRKAYLVFRPGMELLPLLAESLALLPPEKRWGITFSTYLTGLPPGVDCQLAGIVQGSPEHTRLRRAGDAMVIDLCAAVGRAPESAFAQAARSGNVALLSGPAPRAGAEYPLAREAPAAGATVPPRDAQAHGQPHAGSPPPLAPGAFPTVRAPETVRARRSFRRKAAPKWPYALLASVAIIIFGGGAALWWAASGKTETTKQRPLVAEREPQPDEQVEERVPTEPDAEAEALPAESEAEQIEVGEPSDDPPEDTGEADDEQFADPEEPSGPGEQADEEESAEEDITEESQVEEPIEVPPDSDDTAGESDQPAGAQQDGDQNGEAPEPRPTVSFAIDIVPGKAEADEEGWYAIPRPGLVQECDDIELELAGRDKVFSDEPILNPVTTNRLSVGGQKKGATRWVLETRQLDLAEFELHQRGLRFRWNAEPSDLFNPRKLRNCLLVVTGHGTEQRVATIALRKPLTIEQLSMDGFLERQARTVHVPIADLPTTLDELRWEFAPGTVGGQDGEPEVTFPEPSEFHSTRVFSVTIPNEEPIKVEVTRIAFTRSGGALQVSFGSRIQSSPLITPPWSKGTTPFETERFTALGEEVERRIEQAGRELKKQYKGKQLDSPEQGLKHFGGMLHTKQQQRKHWGDRVAEEGVTDESREAFARLDRDIGHMEPLVAGLTQIVELRAYRNRLVRLRNGQDALGRVRVGYRIYLELGEGQRILLVEGTKEPPETGALLPGFD